MLKIKVLLVVEAMLGGIRQHVVDIALGLDSEKYDVYIIYSDARADDRFLIDKAVLEKKVHMILCREMGRELSLKKDLAAYLFVKKCIEEIQPDIVHGHSSKGGIIGRLAAKRCGIKKIFYTPNAYAFQNPNISELKKNLYILAEHLWSKYMTTMTINVSKGEMKKALDYGVDKPDKFVLIYNGIPQIELAGREELREREGFDKGKFLVGVTARCAEQKDPFTFLKIAQMIVEMKDNVEFVYIGDGKLEQQMKNWIKENHLEEKIHMFGFRKNASELVGMFDIYLSTALYEGLPYSMMEAMRAGVPIIATDVEGNNELVINGKNGGLFEAGNVIEGSAMICRQMEQKMIKREDVLKTYEEKFSLTTMLKGLMSVYCSGGGGYKHLIKGENQYLSTTLQECGVPA